MAGLIGVFPGRIPTRKSGLKTMFHPGFPWVLRVWHFHLSI
jgi:hypothetical protein